MTDARDPRDPREPGARAGGWAPVATYGAVYEAEIGRAVLEAGGFDARVEGGEWIGIFGPGFSGTTPRGVRVLVPADQAAAARSFLAFRRAEAAEEDAG